MRGFGAWENEELRKAGQRVPGPGSMARHRVVPFQLTDDGVDTREEVDNSTLLASSESSRSVERSLRIFNPPVWETEIE